MANAKTKNDPSGYRTRAVVAGGGLPRKPLLKKSASTRDLRERDAAIDGRWYVTFTKHR
jgi:hypothetical protein